MLFIEVIIELGTKEKLLIIYVYVTLATGQMCAFGILQMRYAVCA